MDLLKWVFLESRAALAVVLGLGMFALLVHWRRTLKPRLFICGMATCALLWIVQGAITTQREHAATLMARIESDLLASRDDALDRLLSGEFTAGAMRRQAFLQLVQRALRRIQLVSLTQSHLRITSSDAQRFTVDVGYISQVRLRDFGLQPLRSSWSIEFVKGGEQWMIARIEPLEFDGAKLEWDQLSHGF